MKPAPSHSKGALSCPNLNRQGYAKGQCERIFGPRFRKNAASGEPTITANATCLRTTRATMTPVAVPAATGMDLNNKSITTPVLLPTVASIIHFHCLRFMGFPFYT
jgi:hypothetical protein